MLRHGESEWNKSNLFTGWVDIPLSLKGIEESLQAGTEIADLPVDIIFTSSLIRAQTTAVLAMAKHKSGKVPLVLHPGQGKLEQWAQIYSPKTKKNTIPLIISWELNERMYGELQGLNKQEMREKFGESQVQLWRRSYDTRPPEGESLAMTAERAWPYFQNTIMPHLKQGKNVFISAHGNSMRAIIMHLDKLSKDEIVSLEIPTGKPIIYDYTDGKWTKG